MAADAAAARRADGRLLVGAVAVLCSVPLLFLALGRPGGETVGFMLLMGAGCALMYAYYSCVYSTIQDVTEPALRGTAMALYFFAMYVLGASLGPYGTGLVSDFFTARAAGTAGVTAATQAALEPFRAEGLRTAMYLIPALGALLTLVLFAASRTVSKDVDRLQRWMRESAAAEATTEAELTGVGTPK
jgi:MFS family permease